MAKEKHEPSQPELTIGAPSALKWLAEQEVKAREHEAKCLAILRQAEKDQLEKPMEKDGTDWDRLASVARGQHKAAMEDIAELQKRLLLFDKNVSAERRDTTERISKDEGIQLMQRMGIYLRGGCEALITKLCSEILACRNPQEVHVLLAGALRETILGSIDNALKEGHLPGWVKEALADVL